VAVTAVENASTKLVRSRSPLGNPGGILLAQAQTEPGQKSARSAQQCQDERVCGLTAGAPLNKRASGATHALHQKL
jgi:hypothetical protein